MLNRRQLLSVLPSGLVMPRFLHPRGFVPLPPGGSDRKFLFIYCYGGWDVTMAFVPTFDNPDIDVEEDATTAESNGVTYVDSPQRPAVRSFMEAYGDRVCVVNGYEVRSITHERCRRLMLTGTSEGGSDDWPSMVAGIDDTGLLVPYLVVSGPAFTEQFSSKVVRVGENGQLSALLGGSALEMSDLAVAPPSAAASSLTDAFVRERVAAFQAASAGRQAAFAEGYDATLNALDTLSGMSGLDFTYEEFGCSRYTSSEAATIFDGFELGLTRCGMTMYDGYCRFGWDTHSQNQPIQSKNYEQLFFYLGEIMEDLAARTSPTGAPLIDEVTIVLLSEMGRHPQVNASLGRDHWTYTSAVFIGAGVRGGQVIGGMDENFLGKKIDLASGETTESGTSLLPGNIGATILALADIDPAEWIEQAEPITAVLA